MSSPLASVAVINAMIFGVYGNVQRRLSDPESLASHAFAGSVAGFVQSFVSSPMELVKTRLQIQEQMCAGGNQLYKYVFFETRFFKICSSHPLLVAGAHWIAPNKSGARKESAASFADWVSQLPARSPPSAFISRATRR